MKNSDHNKIPYFISCFANQLSILDKSKCWFTCWTLLKTFQTEANSTTNTKYERQTKQTLPKKRHSRLCICFSELVTQSGMTLEPCFYYSQPNQQFALFPVFSMWSTAHRCMPVSFSSAKHKYFLPQRTRSLTQCLSKQTLFIITGHSCHSDFIYITFLQWVKLHI